MNSLLKYGIQFLIENPNIVNERKIGTISNYDIDEIKKLKLIDFQNYNYKIINKIHYQNYNMDWHLDDAQIIKHSNKVYPDQIQIANKKYINYSNEIPEYSMIIYDSEYNIDFKGGTFEFVDKTLIYPKKGLYLFFNSKEVHRVNNIIEGTRKNKLIKFYKKK